MSIRPRTLPLVFLALMVGPGAGCLDAGAPSPDAAGDEPDRSPAPEPEPFPNPDPAPDPAPDPKPDPDPDPKPDPDPDPKPDPDPDPDPDTTPDPEPSADCVSTVDVQVVFDDIAASWWGSSTPRNGYVPIQLSGTPCVPLRVVTSGELVSARLNEFAGWQVRVEWRPDLALPSGRYTGAVVLLEGDRELASVSVHATVFGSSGNPDAPRKSLAIGIDGLRSDGLARANTPNLDRLALGGASTLDASTQRTADTMSGPGWASILTGVEAEDHDVDGNADLGQIDRAFPTFLKRAKDGMGLRTAAVSQWAPILDWLFERDAMDHRATGDHAEVTAEMAAVLTAAQHDVHFMHFDDVDHAGHGSAFSPDDAHYIEAIERVDAGVGVLLDAILSRPDVAEEEWLITMTSDHGGQGNTHGPRDRVHRRIPLFVSTTLPGGPLGGFPSHLDIAPTTLAFHGIRPQRAWGIDGLIQGLGIEVDCADGIDDDGDGAADCLDADCEAFALCSAECPLAELDPPDLGAAPALEETNVDRPNLLAGSCGGAEGPEMTWRFTAPRADRWFFETSQSAVDTVLYILDGDCGGEELACNDDWFGNARYDVPISNQSALMVELAEGQSVIVVVDGFRSNAVGDLDLRVVGVGQTCPDADLGEQLGDAVAQGDNAGLPTRLHASCAGAARDTLLSWTAPEGGRYIFDTAGSDFDTVLAIHAGACGEELGCDDDGGPSQTSRVEVELAEGAAVTVSVSGFRGRTGAWRLNISRRD